MNQTSQNSSNAAVALDDKQSQHRLLDELAGSSNGAVKPPYVPEKGKQDPSLKERAGILLAGAGIVVAVLLLVFGRLVHFSPSAAESFPLFPKHSPGPPAQ